jgi:hypothetical protein
VDYRFPEDDPAKRYSFSRRRARKARKTQLLALEAAPSEPLLAITNGDPDETVDKTATPAQRPRMTYSDAVSLNGQRTRLRSVKLYEFDTDSSLNLDALIIPNAKLDSMLDRQYPDTPVNTSLEVKRSSVSLAKRCSTPSPFKSRAVIRAVETASTEPL